MTTTTFSEGVRSYIYSDRSMLNVSIPAVIETYNPSTQKCVCTPLVNHNRTALAEVGNGTSVPYPTIVDVPVIFPASNLSCITFPLNKGDTVLLVFSQRSLDNWLSTTEATQINPQDTRRHDLSDAVAIPGLFSFPRAPNDPLKHTLIHDTDDLVITHNLNTSNENEVRLKADGSIRMSAGANTKLTLNLDGSVVLDAPTSLTVTAPVTTWIGDINQQGTFTSDTDVVANGTSLDTHTHGGVQTGGGSTGAPN
tara:strand:- start:4956 stop:5714 length:759 start_codon:yes stop_codon:yes gene_type:complete